MTVADEFARLIADGNLRLPPTTPYTTQSTGGGLMRTSTVYSVGEAISRREQAKNAKLGASSI